jgi:hypothetical protein
VAAFDVGGNTMFEETIRTISFIIEFNFDYQLNLDSHSLLVDLDLIKIEYFPSEAVSQLASVK